MEEEEEEEEEEEKEEEEEVVKWNLNSAQITKSKSSRFGKKNLRGFREDASQGFKRNWQCHGCRI